MPNQNHHHARWRLAAIAAIAIMILPVGTLTWLGMADDARQRTNSDYLRRVDNHLGAEEIPRLPVRPVQHLRAPAAQRSFSTGEPTPDVDTPESVDPPGSSVPALVDNIKRLPADQTEQRDQQTQVLRRLLGDEFDAMHTRQKAQIQRTQQRLDALAKTHANRAAQKDVIVQRRIDQLLGKPDSLAWNPERSSGLGPTASTAAAGWALAASHAFETPARPAPISAAPPPPTQDAALREDERRLPVSEDYFRLAREMARVIAESERTEQERQRLAHDILRGAAPQSAMDQVERRLASLQVQIDLYRQQIEVTRRRLQRQLSHAQRAFHRAEQIHEIVQKQLKHGTSTALETMRSAHELGRAEQTLEDLGAELKHFNAAIDRLPDDLETIEVDQRQDQNVTPEIEQAETIEESGARIHRLNATPRDGRPASVPAAVA